MNTPSIGRWRWNITTQERNFMTWNLKSSCFSLLEVWCWPYHRMSIERCRLSGAICIHWHADCLLEELSRKTTKMVSIRNWSITSSGNLSYSFWGFKIHVRLIGWLVWMKMTFDALFRSEIDVTRNVRREKERALTQSYDKNTYTHRKIQKAMWQHKNATKNFDYITIADRLRTVSWSNGSHPIGLIKPVYGIPTLPVTAKTV